MAGKASFERLIVENRTKGKRFNVYPKGETVEADVGDQLYFYADLCNIGVDYDRIWVRFYADSEKVSDAAVDKPPGEGYTATFWRYLPKKPWSFLVEYGHGVGADEAKDGEFRFTIGPTPIPGIEWTPIILAALAPIIFGLSVIGYVEFTKGR